MDTLIVLERWDERMLIKHIVLSHRCSNTISFVHRRTRVFPFYHHCWKENRCPNRSDDQHWCDRQYSASGCSDLRDFICFDGQCLRGARCNRIFDCAFAEDEYMCDYSSSSLTTLVPFREVKRSSQRTSAHILRLSQYPTDAQIVERNSDLIGIIEPPKPIYWFVPSLALLTPYRCNRGVGILIPKTNSTVCFCPPQYYGEKCEYHADRLSVLLHLNLSQSIYSADSDPLILLQLLLLFSFNNQTLMSEQFPLRPAGEFAPVKKLLTHFLYPHSSSFRPQRFFNHHPYSIRIELYPNTSRGTTIADRCLEVSDRLRLSSRVSSGQSSSFGFISSSAQSLFE